MYPPHLCALFRPFAFLVVWAHSLAIIMTVVVSLPQTVARRHRLHTNNSNCAIPMHTHIFIYAIYIWYHIHSAIFYAITTIKRKSITTLKGGWRMLWNSLLSVWGEEMLWLPHFSSSLHNGQPYPYKHEIPNVIIGVHPWTVEVVDLIFFSVVVNLEDLPYPNNYRNICKGLPECFLCYQLSIDSLIGN